MSLVQSHFDSLSVLLASGFYRQAFWMKHFGHQCLKRTLTWSTSWAINEFDLGPIKKTIHKSLVQTTVKYIDGKGSTRYKGAGAALKNTQFLACNPSSCFLSKTEGQYHTWQTATQQRPREGKSWVLIFWPKISNSAFGSRIVSEHQWWKLQTFLCWVELPVSSEIVSSSLCG